LRFEPKGRVKQMPLLPPILEGRISNFHQIWEGFSETSPNFFPKYSFNYLLGRILGGGKS
jgi:hypothetical protein